MKKFFGIMIIGLLFASVACNPTVKKVEVRENADSICVADSIAHSQCVNDSVEHGRFDLP